MLTHAQKVSGLALTMASSLTRQTRNLLYQGPGLARLHQLAKSGSVDPRAQVRGDVEITVAASPEVVWDTIVDLPAWVGLDMDVTEMSAPDEVAVDAPFTWTNSGMTINSRFAVVDPYRELTWTGTTYGVKAVHRITLSAHDDGTLLRTEETMAAPGLALLYPSRKLTRELTTFAGAFARAAESRPVG